MSILTWRHASRDRMADHAQAESLRWAWRQSCIGAGVSLPIENPVAGSMFRTPEITTLSLGPPVTLTVRCLEGTVPAQIRRASHLIAPHLGGITLRVVDRGFGWAVVTVLDHDPLDGVLPLHLPRPDHRILIGRDEGGDEITEDWTRQAHTVV